MMAKSANLKKPKFVTANTAEPYANKKEYFTLPSLTVPNMGLTVSDILDRFTKGLGVPVYDAQFFDDVEVPDPRMLGRVEYLQAAREMRNEAAIIRERLAKKREEKSSPTPPAEPKTTTDD